VELTLADGTKRIAKSGASNDASSWVVLLRSRQLGSPVGHKQAPKNRAAALTSGRLAIRRPTSLVGDCFYVRDRELDAPGTSARLDQDLGFEDVIHGHAGLLPLGEVLGDGDGAA
jgi:hypothetical protein